MFRARAQRTGQVVNSSAIRCNDAGRHVTQEHDGSAALQRDPLEYVDGPNARSYVQCRATSQVDPKGTCSKCVKSTVSRGENKGDVPVNTVPYEYKEAPTGEESKEDKAARLAANAEAAEKALRAHNDEEKKAPGGNPDLFTDDQINRIKAEIRGGAAGATTHRGVQTERVTNETGTSVTVIVRFVGWICLVPTDPSWRDGTEDHEIGHVHQGAAVEREVNKSAPTVPADESKKIEEAEKRAKSELVSADQKAKDEFDDESGHSEPGNTKQFERIAEKAVKSVRSSSSRGSGK